jgi:hypothetical protein
MSAKLEVDIVAKIGDLQKGLDNAGKSVKGLNDNIAKGSKTSAESTKALNDVFKDLGTQLQNAITSVVPFSGQLASMGKLMGGVSGGMKGVSSASKLLKVALMSTGIGAIVVALGSLVAYLTTTQKGMDTLKKVTEPVAQIFQRLLGVLQNLGGNVFKGIAQMLNGELKAGFETLSNGVKQAGKETVGAFTEGVKAGGRLAALTKQIEETQNDLIITSARLNREIAENQELAMDQSKTEGERQKFAQKAIDLINQRTKLENGLLDLQIEKMKLEQEANDTDRAGYAELNQLIAQREQNEADAARQRRRLNNIVNKEVVVDYKGKIEELKKLDQAFLASHNATMSKITVRDPFGGSTEDPNKNLSAERLKLVENATARVLELNKQVAASMPGIIIPEDAVTRANAYTQSQNELNNQLSLVAQNMNAALFIGDMFGQTLASFAETGKLSFKSIIDGLKRMLISLAAAIASAVALNILTGGAVMAAGKAAGAKSGFGALLKGGSISGIGGLTPFAKGGIVSGPTPALVGEYTGAKTNPEVIAPLNKLQNMLGGNVTFSISGDNLVGTLNRANKTRARKF